MRFGFLRPLHLDAQAGRCVPFHCITVVCQQAEVKQRPPERPLVAVIGPTGSGKSELAIAIALEFRGEVVNCDSLQIYRHFDIGTAKLRPDEMRGIPHHLLDVADPDEVFTAGEYARRARAAARGDRRPRQSAGCRRRHWLLPARAARRPLPRSRARRSPARPPGAARAAAPRIAPPPARTLRRERRGAHPPARRAQNHARAGGMPARPPAGQRAFPRGTRRAARGTAILKLALDPAACGALRKARPPRRRRCSPGA